METQKVKVGNGLYAVLKALENFYNEAKDLCLNLTEIEQGQKKIINEMIDDDNVFGRGFCKGYWFLLTDKTLEHLVFGVWENDAFYSSDPDSEYYYFKQGLTGDEFYEKKNNPANLSGLFWRKDIRKNYTMP